MVSVNMLNKISLSKPPFKEILQFCSATVALQTLAKKPFKHLFKVKRSDKFVAKTIYCLLSLFL